MSGAHLAKLVQHIFLGENATPVSWCTPTTSLSEGTALHKRSYFFFFLTFLRFAYFSTAEVLAAICRFSRHAVARLPPQMRK